MYEFSQKITIKKILCNILDIIFSYDEISQLMKYRDIQKGGRLKIRFIALIMLTALPVGTGSVEWDDYKLLTICVKKSI